MVSYIRAMMWSSPVLELLYLSPIYLQSYWVWVQPWGLLYPCSAASLLFPRSVQVCYSRLLARVSFVPRSFSPKLLSSQSAPAYTSAWNYSSLGAQLLLPFVELQDVPVDQEVLLRTSSLSTRECIPSHPVDSYMSIWFKCSPARFSSVEGEPPDPPIVRLGLLQSSFTSDGQGGEGMEYHSHFHVLCHQFPHPTHFSCLPLAADTLAEAVLVLHVPHQVQIQVGTSFPKPIPAYLDRMAATGIILEWCLWIQRKYDRKLGGTMLEASRRRCFFA